MTNIYIIVLILISYVSLTGQSGGMEVEGGIIISGATTNNPVHGTIQWSDTEMDFQGYDGSNWNSLSKNIHSGTEDVSSLAISIYSAFNNLSFTVTNTGLRYKIIQNGNTPPPSSNSTVTFTYSGYYLNGTLFDQNTITTPVNALILGIVEGLQLIGEGGNIELLIPASLAYGTTGTGPINANIPIKFEISLIAIN